MYFPPRLRSLELDTKNESNGYKLNSVVHGGVLVGRLDVQERPCLKEVGIFAFHSLIRLDLRVPDGSQLPGPTRANALVEDGACACLLGMGLMPTKDACSAQPDARGNLISRDLHSTPARSRATERHRASRSLRRSVFRGRLTATRPCRETHRGSVGTPTLADCLWPVMDSQPNDVLSLNNLRALLPSLLTRFARSLRKGTPLNRSVEKCHVVRILAGDNGFVLFVCIRAESRFQP